MANWCSNWVNIELDPKHKDTPRFLKLVEAYDEHAHRVANKRGQGSRPSNKFDHYFFDASLDDISDSLITYRFESKWAPPSMDGFIWLAEKFGCIDSISVDYDEPSMGVYGKYCITRDTYGVSGQDITAPQWVLNAIELMNSSWERSYDNIEDAMDRTGLSELDIHEVLKTTRWTLDEITEEMDFYPSDQF